MKAQVRFRSSEKRGMRIMHRTDLIAIGELAARTGVAVSAIRFYEARGLIEALRTGGGQRRFLRADIRRVSFILIAQQMGLRLEEIGDELARLPAERSEARRVGEECVSTCRSRGAPDN